MNDAKLRSSKSKYSYCQASINQRGGWERMYVVAWRKLISQQQNKTKKTTNNKHWLQSQQLKQVGSKDKRNTQTGGRDKRNAWKNRGKMDRQRVVHIDIE